MSFACFAAGLLEASALTGRNLVGGDPQRVGLGTVLALAISIGLASLGVKDHDEDNSDDTEAERNPLRRGKPRSGGNEKSGKVQPTIVDFGTLSGSSA